MPIGDLLQGLDRVQVQRLHLAPETLQLDLLAVLDEVDHLSPRIEALQHIRGLKYGLRLGGERVGHEPPDGAVHVLELKLRHLAPHRLHEELFGNLLSIPALGPAEKLEQRGALRYEVPLELTLPANASLSSVELGGVLLAHLIVEETRVRVDEMAQWLEFEGQWSGLCTWSCAEARAVVGADGAVSPWIWASSCFNRVEASLCTRDLLLEFSNMRAVTSPVASSGGRSVPRGLS